MFLQAGGLPGLVNENDVAVSLCGKPMCRCDIDCNTKCVWLISDRKIELSYIESHCDRCEERN